MSKGFCSDGVSVDAKVSEFQKTRRSDEFVYISRYYDDYKDYWYRQVEELIDRDEFDRDWGSRLLHSIDTYNEAKAIQICRTHGWSMAQKFNRWFYRALKNWISNINTQSFRTKRRPGIICPICFREVGKIDEQHLEHRRTTKDLPRAFEFNGVVYKTMLKPRKKARMFTCSLKEALKYSKIKHRTVSCKWPWHIDGNKGVMCPFTHNIVPYIDNEYISKLHYKYRHYAKKTSWFEFHEAFPSYMVHNDVLSIDFTSGKNNKDMVFVNNIGVNRRFMGSTIPSYATLVVQMNAMNAPVEYEYAVTAIDNNVDDKIDKDILRYMMIGYDERDICEELEITRKELKARVEVLSGNKKLEIMLSKGVM